MRRRVGVMTVPLACLVVLFVAPLASAQTPGEGPLPASQPLLNARGSLLPPDSPDWGINSYIAYVVPAWSFNNRRDAQHHVNGGYMNKSGGTESYFDQTIYLPSGAIVDGVTTYYYDVDASANVEFYFYRMTYTGAAAATPTLLFVQNSTGNGGFQAGYAPLTTSETILNYSGSMLNAYYLVVGLKPSGSQSDLSFGGVAVWYRLQISPAPATATFYDVPTDYWAFRHIQALAASGITAGCAAGYFCPENYVKRSEMAVYLAKALGLHWPDA